jgi:hypothetical protein
MSNGSRPHNESVIPSCLPDQRVLIECDFNIQKMEIPVKGSSQSASISSIGEYRTTWRGRRPQAFCSSHGSSPADCTLVVNRRMVQTWPAKTGLSVAASSPSEMPHEAKTRPRVPLGRVVS